MGGARRLRKGGEAWEESNARRFGHVPRNDPDAVRQTTSAWIEWAQTIVDRIGTAQGTIDALQSSVQELNRWSWNTSGRERK
jgi:hypothetical protein